MHVNNLWKKKYEMEDKVFYLYQRIGKELTEELSTLGKLTDLIQYFNDNDIVALRQIYEGDKDEFLQELKSNAS